MSEIPDDLRYTEDHEWLRADEDGAVVMGITDHAQDALGALVFVEVPEPGQPVIAGDACAVVESVKAASDIYCPISGEIIAVNESLNDAPERINTDPYGDGWIIRLKVDNPADLGELLDAEAYGQLLESEDD